MENEKIENYCMRCKTKREMVKTTETKTSKGVRMLKGECVKCQCKMCKMLGK